MCGALLNKFRDLEITTKKIIPGDMPFLFEEVDKKFLCLPKSIINFGDTQSIFVGKKARLCELINRGKPLKMFASENSAHFRRRPPFIDLFCIIYVLSRSYFISIFIFHMVWSRGVRWRTLLRGRTNVTPSLLRCLPLKIVLIFGGTPLSLIFLYHICVVRLLFTVSLFSIWFDLEKFDDKLFIG